jgi:uncharacterized membrane protein
MVSAAVYIISSKAIKAELKREGYTSKNKSSVWELLQASLYLIIPVFNIILAVLVLLMFDYFKEQVKQDFSREGE